ncbi:midasin [Caerostris extrusa]|uniref:Midasin n=1 Tax=Caerostris extrusa TaxID=172846 RepID=A0AAV4Y958_CAEEX|nr:midasin [Caerostris extrusa]
MRRLAVLVGKAIEFNEPVLLIGNTGCGKTTMCQIFAQIFGKKMYSVNCHMHSESSDFLGGLRPVRDAAKKEEFSAHNTNLLKQFGNRCYEFLGTQVDLSSLPAPTTALATLGLGDVSNIPIGVFTEGNKESFGIGPFRIEFGNIHIFKD